jgi:PAS domain S-box-containing protein
MRGISVKSVIPNLELASLLCRSGTDPLLIGNILDSMSDSVLVLDQAGRILCCNRITHDILGYDPQELVANGLETLILNQPENKELHQILFDMIRKRSIQAYAEVDYHHPDHSVRRLATTTSHLVDVSDRETSFVGFVALFKDITEVSRLRRKERELIQEKHRIASEKARSLQKVAMGVAHEIRNPMVTIGGFAGRITKAADDPEQVKRYAENVLAAARQLETIVEAVHQCCNLPVFRAYEENISAVISEGVSDMMPQALQKNVHMNLSDATSGDHLLVVDPLLLKMALSRLIQNAIDFSEKGAEVDILLDLHDSGAMLEVRDHGAGIKEDDLEFIFDPFFSTVPNRSGMGLAVVERVVQEHMGTMEVESKPGQGTVIRILLQDLRGKSSD